MFMRCLDGGRSNSLYFFEDSLDSIASEERVETEILDWLVSRVGDKRDDRETHRCIEPDTCNDLGPVNLSEPTKSVGDE